MEDIILQYELLDQKGQAALKDFLGYLLQKHPKKRGKVKAASQKPAKGITVGEWLKRNEGIVWDEARVAQWERDIQSHMKNWEVQSW